MTAPDALRVRVVYAAPAAHHERELSVAPGTTLAEAIRLSGIAAGAGLAENDLRHTGIFGRRADADTVLRDGDRVEIYRELKIDPKEARRRRALGG